MKICETCKQPKGFVCRKCGMPICANCTNGYYCEDCDTDVDTLAEEE